MYNDKIKCTSRICPYINACSRHIRDNPNDFIYSCIDLTYNGCDLGSGFDMYIPNTERINR